MKAVIVDDELYCAEALSFSIQKYCKQITELIYFTDPEIALEHINNNPVDILFLDIEMPYFSGFEILKLARDFTGSVIFTTAYNMYAIEAFKVDALDYLLKPIDKVELMKAVEKAFRNVSKTDHSNLLKILKTGFENQKPLHKKVSIHTSDGIHLISTHQIIRCESDGSYSHIHIENTKSLLVSKNLKDLEELFCSESFFRVHKSHLINIDHIKMVSKTDGGEVIMNDETRVPISRTIKQDFFNLLK
ncbi:MAG: response regulator transcription factor [Saprospiraceae bacterium]|nr:response regulator transcription factor [Saprospiraceae bacterium]